MKVNRTEQQIIKKNNPIYDIVDQYCLYSKNVYNQANYIMRQEFINNGNKIGAYDVQKLMQSMDCYKECGSQAAQKTIQLVDNQEMEVAFAYSTMIANGDACGLIIIYGTEGISDIDNQLIELTSQVLSKQLEN